MEGSTYRKHLYPVSQCCVVSCNSKVTDKSKKFYSFPTDSKIYPLKAKRREKTTMTCCGCLRYIIKSAVVTLLEMKNQTIFKAQVITRQYFQLIERQYLHFLTMH
ncbi:uncharacterized protein LOC106657548 [Trichogramma pretiosum]|uniref:uncharacterized protein LOC106657548 n=1 Tax=Trichogramma pretiosum TaxID=7493 RepID=UPI0006C95FA4|nr:uncharacterized protein LOC106657548 [Trichogramma pretiosum]